ncbi:MAG: PAS domain S-box protein [Methylovirgula sp.]
MTEPRRLRTAIRYLISSMHLSRPIGRSMTQHAYEYIRRYWSVAIVAIVGFGISILAFGLIRQSQLARADAAIYAQIGQRHRAIEETLHQYEDVVNTLSVYLDGSGGAHSEADFSVVANSLMKQHGGIQALDYALRISGSARKAFEAKMRDRGDAGFEILDLTPGSRPVRAGERSEYFPIVDFAPQKGNQMLLGVDLGYNRRNVLDRSLATGRLASTGPVKLIQEQAGNQYGIVIAGPVYSSILKRTTAAERRADLIGYAVAAFRVDDMFNEILRTATISGGFSLYVFDGRSPDPAKLVYAHAPQLQAGGAHPLAFTLASLRPGFAKIVMFADRPLTLVSVPLAGVSSVAVNASDWTILLAGILATILAALLLLSTIRRSEALKVSTETLGQEIAERQHLEDRVKQERDTAQRYLDVVDVMIFVLNPDGTVASINRKGCEILGEPLTAIVGQNWIDRFVPERLKEAAHNEFQDLLAGRKEKWKSSETYIVAKDGKELLISSHHAPIFDGDGHCIGLINSGEDITARKHAEEQLLFANTLLRTEMETAPNGILVVDNANTIVSFNHRFLEMWHIPPELIEARIDEHVLASVVAQVEDPESFVARIRELYAHPDQQSIDNVATKDGRFIERHSAGLTTPAGQYLGRIWFFRDITEQKTREEAVQRSEAELREAQHVAGLGSWSWDPASDAVTWSEELYRITGRDPHQPVPNLEQQASLFKPESYAIVVAALQAVLTHGTSYAVELEFIRPDDTEGWMLARGEAERDSDGIVRRVRGTALDITARHRAMRKLEEEEAKFRSLVEQNVAGIVIIGDNGAIVYCNTYFAKLAGYQAAEMIGRPLFDFLPEAERPKVRDSLQSQIFERAEFVQIASTIKAKNGRIIEVLVNASRAVFEGRPASIAVVLDITERKRAESRLIEAQAQLTEAQALAHVGSWELDLLDNSAEWSDECYRIFGVDLTTITPSLEAFISRVHPDDRDTLISAHRRSLEDRTACALDHRIVLADGTVRFVHQRWKSDYDVDGRPVRTLGTIQDITDRKMAENALIQERDFSTALINSLPGLFIMMDPAGHITRWNKNMATITGLADEQLLGFDAFLFPIPEDREMMQTKLKDIFVEHVADAEFRIADTAGDVHVIRWSGAATQCHGLPQLLAIGIDITEMREAAERLRISQSRYHDLFESTRDAIMVVDPSAGTVVAGNAAAVELFRSRDMQEFLSHPPWFWSPERQPDGQMSAEKVRILTETALRQGSNFFEWAHKRSNGEEFIAEVLLTPIIEEGRTLIYGTVRDISERKRAAQAIAYRGELLRSVNIAATEFLTVGAFDDSVNHVLKITGEAVHADRVVMLEMQKAEPGSLPLALRYAWHSQTAPVVLNDETFLETYRGGPDFDAWFAPLAEGNPLVAQYGSTTGAIRALFDALAIKSIAIVPVTVDGKLWGLLGFDDCRIAREWNSAELDILRTLADLIGTSIQRERYIAELADATRIVQNSPTMLYRVRGEPSLPLMYISHNITSFGYDQAAMIASPEFYKTLIHPDDQPAVRDAMMGAVEKSSTQGMVEFRLRTSNGDYRWIENRFTPIRDKTGRLREIEGVMVDITERKAAEEKISLLARTDPLTGLANRATFIEYLRQAFASAQRGANPFSVFYLDLDHFKDINDTLGHQVGDLLLKTAADRLSNITRQSDLVARLGGDEFAILQTEMSDLSGAGTLATKIRQTLAEPIYIASYELHITVSVGISPYTADTTGPDEMLAQADLALYRAKEEGRDQYRFHSPDLDVQVRERVLLSEDLHRALERDELELYYQPQVELATARIVGMEALIRWNHPTRGILLPSAFLPAAEKTGVMTGIGQWVLEHACEQMHIWRIAGIAPATLAVNLSMVQLKIGSEFVDYIKALLARWDLPAQALELDVTESMLVHATMVQNDVLEQLQKLGINIAIDDFGTQYSSLDYLKTYHVSRVKIPQLMMSAAMDDPGDAAMVRAIVGIARELNIEVVAQGIEAKAQQSLLTSAASTAMVQGFYYSEPVPALQAAQLLTRGLIVPKVERHTKRVRAAS